jgi:hypothetical protein
MGQFPANPFECYESPACSIKRAEYVAHSPAADFFKNQIPFGWWGVFFGAAVILCGLRLQLVVNSVEFRPEYMFRKLWVI